MLQRTGIQEKRKISRVEQEKKDHPKSSINKLRASMWLENRPGWAKISEKGGKNDGERVEEPEGL